MLNENFRVRKEFTFVVEFSKMQRKTRTHLTQVETRRHNQHWTKTNDSTYTYTTKEGTGKRSRCSEVDDTAKPYTKHMLIEGSLHYSWRSRAHQTLSTCMNKLCYQRAIPSR